VRHQYQNPARNSVLPLIKPPEKPNYYHKNDGVRNAEQDSEPEKGLCRICNEIFRKNMLCVFKINPNVSFKDVIKKIKKWFGLV